MEHAVTFGDVLLVGATIFGVIIICGMALWFLSAIAEGFRH